MDQAPAQDPVAFAQAQAQTAIDNTNQLHTRLSAVEAGLAANSAASTAAANAAAVAANTAAAGAAHRPPLKPPTPDTFSGENRERLAVHDWSATLTQYYEAAGYPEDAVRINYASCLLRGPALRWWRDIPHAQRPNTWTDFVVAITSYFLPAGSDERGRQQLHRLVQTKSVASYTDAFRAIASTIPTMTEAEKTATYREGLKQEVKLQVAFSNPSTFEEAVLMASRIDEILYNHGARGRRDAPRPGRGAGGGGAASSSAPMDLGAVQNGPPPRRNNDAPKLAPLTDKERERLRALGACFRCRQTGHQSRECPLGQGNGQRRRQ
jgi:hypothetical protein